MAASKKGKKGSGTIARSSSPRPPPANVTPGTPSGVHQVVTQHSQTRANFLPTPTPDVLAEYAEMIPDAPERFLRVYEDEVQHRRKLEERDQRDDSRIALAVAIATFAGPLCATAVACAFGYVALEVARAGHPAAAGIIAACDIGAVVYAFTKSHRRD